MQDLTGHTYGRLHVTGFAGYRIYNSGTKRFYQWYCDCDCGTKDYVVTAKQLRTSNRPTLSCGCRTLEAAVKNCIKRSRTHGETFTTADGKRHETTEYRCWKTIKRRCYNPKSKQYQGYGGRGIRVCDRWLESFLNFLEDMGRKPSPLHSIERSRVNGNYEPGNCYWATDKEQRRNRRTTVWITLNGQTKARVDWLEELGIKKSIYDYRVYECGKTPEEALLMGPTP